MKCHKGDITVVFVHGLWGTSLQFVPWMVQSYHREFRVVAWTPTPEDRVSIEGWWKSLNNFLDSLKGKKVLVGHSLGGYMVQRLENQRDDIIGVVPVASAGPWSLLNCLGPALPHTLKYMVSMAINRRFRPSHEDARDYLYNQHPSWKKFLFNIALDHGFISARVIIGLRSVNGAKCPILIVQAGEDRLGSPLVSRLLAWRHRAEILRVPYGHMVPECDKGDTIEHILDWIEREVLTR